MILNDSLQKLCLALSGETQDPALFSCLPADARDKTATSLSPRIALPWCVFLFSVNNEGTVLLFSEEHSGHSVHFIYFYEFLPKREWNVSLYFLLRRDVSFN